MKKIIVKEIEQYTSTFRKDKTVSEYMIYLVMDNNKIISANLELGEDNKRLRVNELLLQHFASLDTLQVNNVNEIVEEIAFNDYLKTIN
jgi:hypothetical protein